MTILSQIKDYITDCRKAGHPHDTFAIEHDEYGDILREAFIEEDMQWVKNYTPYYSLTKEERQTPGLVGIYMGVNIVRKP